MNYYTQLLYYIKSLADADVFVNTITQGDFSRLDLDKMNVYPLLHIQINSASFTNGQTVNFDVQIGCYAQRNTNKEINTDKFWLNDNEVDNFNETLATLNRLWLQMFRDFEKNNITASENPTLDPQSNVGTNTLDGWVLTFDVAMPNTTISLCP